MLKVQGAVLGLEIDAKILNIKVNVRKLDELDDMSVDVEKERIIQVIEA